MHTPRVSTTTPSPSLYHNSIPDPLQVVVKLQSLFPSARLVYASATGASEPQHLGFAVRLGLWNTGEREDSPAALAAAAAADAAAAARAAADQQQLYLLDSDASNSVLTVDSSGAPAVRSAAVAAAAAPRILAKEQMHAFDSFESFVKAMQQGGTSALEIVSRDMKVRGEGGNEQRHMKVRGEGINSVGKMRHAGTPKPTHTVVFQRDWACT